MSSPSEPTYFCSIHKECTGLHDPFVCRVIPAALLWLSKQKQQRPHFMAPPGLVDALLTQALHDSHEFEQAGYMSDFCDYVSFNYISYFDAVYLDQPADLAPLQRYVQLLRTADHGKAEYARDLLRFFIEGQTNKA